MEVTLFKTDTKADWRQARNSLARTIADLEGTGPLATKHIAEAIQYRTLDRTYWV